MKKVNKENTFLTIWIFCVVLLTLLFPVSFIRGTRAYFGDNMSGQLGAGYQIKYISNFPSDLNKTVENHTDSVVSEIYVIIDNTFEADGYEFVGWNTKSDGTGKVYEVKEVYYDKLNLTLYAQWKKIEVIVISYGDVNLNNLIDENDYLLLENHVSGISELSGQSLLNADVNTDGKIDLVDVDIIKQAYLRTTGYINILPSNPILIYEIYKEENVQEPILPDKPTEDDDIDSDDKDDSNGGGEGGIDDDDITVDNTSGDYSLGNNDVNDESNTSNNTGQGSGNSDKPSSGGAVTGGGNGSSGTGHGSSSSSGSGNGNGSSSGNKPSARNSNDDKKEELPEEDKEEFAESDKNNDVESDKNDIVQNKDNASFEKEEKSTGDSIVYVAIIVFGICLLSFRLILHVIYKFREKNKNSDIEDE